MDDTDLSFDHLKNVSSSNSKIEVKFEEIEFEDFDDCEDNLNNNQEDSGIALEVKKEQMSYHEQDENVKELTKLPTTSLVINSPPSSNSVDVNPEGNTSSPLEHTSNPHINIPEQSQPPVNIQKNFPPLDYESNDILNSSNMITRISEKLSQNLNDSKSKASGESKKTLHSDKIKNKKSYLSCSASKSRNKKNYGTKTKVISAVMDKNQESNLHLSSHATNTISEHSQEVSTSIENHSKQIQMSSGSLMNIAIRNESCNNDITDVNCKLNKKDCSEAYPSDSSNYDKGNHCGETSNTFDLAHNDQEDEQVIDHSEAIHSIEENRDYVRETCYNENCLENSPFPNVENLTQKSNARHDDDDDGALKDSFRMDDEVMNSCDVHEVNSKNDCSNIREINTLMNKENGGEKGQPQSPLISKENGDEKSQPSSPLINNEKSQSPFPFINKKNGEKNSRFPSPLIIKKKSHSLSPLINKEKSKSRIPLINEENGEKNSRSPSPLTSNTNVRGGHGKEGEILRLTNSQEVLTRPLNRNSLERIEIEKSTRVEEMQPEKRPTFCDTQKQNNKNSSEEITEILFPKEKEKTREPESDLRSGFNFRNLRTKNIEVINLEEEEPKKLYSCPHCNFTTSNKFGQKLHLLIHSNVKSFRNPHDTPCTSTDTFAYPQMQSAGLECYFCGYKCMRKNKLEKHLYENHFRRKVYKCYVCSYECTDLDLLQRHSETHFGNGTFSAANCHKCSCDHVRQMTSHKRAFPDEEGFCNSNCGTKYRKLDCHQETQLGDIMKGLDNKMSKMNENISELTQTIKAQVNELSTVASCFKTYINSAIDASVSDDDSTTIRPSTSHQQKTPNSGHPCWYA